MKSYALIKLYRKKIDKINEKLIKLIAKRNEFANKIRKEKIKLGLPLSDTKREKEILEKVNKLSKKFRVDTKVVEKIVKLLIKNAKSMD